MATTNTDAIASSFLRALSAPDTPEMRAAVTAWLRQEGISSVKRNNPWNLHQGAPCGGDADRGKFCPRTALPGQIGVVNVAPGDKNVAVFSTLDAGVAANARNLERLSGSGYGYDRVIAWARAGDPVNFLHSLALSSWSAGRYGTRGGGANKLVTIYNGITGAKADPKGYTAIGKTPTGVGKVSSGLSKESLGSPSKEDLPGPTNPLDAIAGFLGAVLDPANWIRILAIVVGLVMTAWGGMNLLRSAA